MDAPLITDHTTQGSGFELHIGKDECVAMGYTCHPDATCTGVGRSSRCRCKDEFEGDGISCRRRTVVTSCHGTITSSNTRIQYPDFGYYKDDEDCRWVIDINEPVYIRFTKFDIEIGPSCIYDSLSIMDDRKYIGKYCGGSLPPIVVSRGKNIVITFNSDGSSTGTGFALQIGKATCYSISCSVHASCETVNNIPRCSCYPGYRGNGHNCTVSSRCWPECHGFASCIEYGTWNTSHYCECYSGYSGNGTYCTRRKRSSSGTFNVAGVIVPVIVVVVFIFCCMRNRCAARQASVNRTNAASVTVAAYQNQSVVNDTNNTEGRVRSNSLPLNTGPSELSTISSAPPMYQPYYIPTMPPPKETPSVPGYMYGPPPPPFAGHVPDTPPPPFPGDVPPPAFPADLPPPPSYDEAIR